MAEKKMYLEQLKKVQEIQLNIALEVKRICNKHEIKYSLIAGTLLGAIRHKGFIPWDDDMDIGMLRSEYEKFIEVAKKELSNDYFLQTWETDLGFGMPFAKIRKNGTKYVEKNSIKTDQHEGIFIDIFPFDAVPNSRLRKKTHELKTYILKRLLLIKLGYQLWDSDENFKKNIYRIISVVIQPISLEYIKEKLKNEMVKYNNYSMEEVVTIGGSYGYRKETIFKKWLENLQTIEFEKCDFLAPVENVNYLEKFYGDYKELPPEEKRYNRHGIIDIDFGEDGK